MKSLIIKNFKCITELHLPQLSTINLITGKNNVGKSTLLEAIAIYASNGSFPTIYKLLEDRGEHVRYRTSDIDNKEILQNAISSLFPLISARNPSGTIMRKTRRR